MASPRKHPAPTHLRPKVDLNLGIDKTLALSQSYLSAQASADAKNKLATETATLTTARAQLVAQLAKRADLAAALYLAQAELVVAVDVHNEAIKDYARQAAKVANGDVSTLATLGVDAVTRGPRGVGEHVEAPAQVVVVPGENPGEARLRCDKVPHARAYVFAYKLEPAQPTDPWLPEGGIQTSRVSTTLSGLPAGQALRVRARAIGGVAGPWSVEGLGNSR